MSLKNTAERYGAVTKFFHWLLFLLLLGAMVAGNINADMPDGPEKLDAVVLHKAFGVLILLLALLRLGWRLINPLPRDLAVGWQQIVSVWVHRLLYVLMFAQPISGILMSQAAGYPVSFFGLFDVPMVIAENEALAKGVLHECHEWIWRVLALIVIIHALAAFYHHFVAKNDVLRRMGFGKLKSG